MLGDILENIFPGDQIVKTKLSKGNLNVMIL